MSQISREELFTIWLSQVKSKKYEAVEKHVLSIFGADVDYSKLKDHLQKLCSSFQARWSESHRDKARFMHKNAIWLKSSVTAAEFALDVAPSTSSHCGRRENDFFI